MTSLSRNAFLAAMTQAAAVEDFARDRASSPDRFRERLSRRLALLQGRAGGESTALLRLRVAAECAHIRAKP